MTQFNCCIRCGCTVAAGLAAAVLGVIAAFAQITGMITVTTAALWVAFAIAAVYLPVLVLGAAAVRTEPEGCLCPALTAALAGILGTILFALVLLAFGITATGVVSAIVVGLLTASLTLTFGATACLVRQLYGCTA